MNLPTLTLTLTALALLATGCASLPPADAEGLVGTWQLVAIGGAAPDVPVASLTFGADGHVSGMTGCNRLTGTYELTSDGAIRLSPLATTRMACAPAAMGQERRLLDALAGVARAEVEEGRLALRGEAGTLVLVRDDGSGPVDSPNTGALPGPEWPLTEIRPAAGAAETATAAPSRRTRPATAS